MRITICTPLGADWRLWSANIRDVWDVSSRVISYNVAVADRAELYHTGQSDWTLAKWQAVDTDGRALLCRGPWGGMGVIGEQDCRDRMFANVSGHVGVPRVALSIDCDERAANVDAMVTWLAARAHRRTEVLMARWVTIYKYLPGGSARIISSGGSPTSGSVCCGVRCPAGEAWPVPTEWRHTYSRRVGPPEAIGHVQSPLVLCHDSWDRAGAGPREKLKNWTHRHECTPEALERFCAQWDTATAANYRDLRNFHPDANRSQTFASLELVSASALAIVGGAL